MTIPEALYRRMLGHCAACYPNEACGLLAGSAGEVSGIWEMENIEPSPVSYQLDPAGQFRVMKEMREKGVRLSGIYHSHPQSPAYPSSKDIELAFYDDAVYIIVSLIDRASPEVRAFRIVGGKVDGVEIKVMT